MKSGEPVFCDGCQHVFEDYYVTEFADVTLCEDCQENLIRRIDAKLQTPVRSTESEKRNSD
jgi:hypothetical protein